jgi:hypothetical protein
MGLNWTTNPFALNGNIIASAFIQGGSLAFDWELLTSVMRLQVPGTSTPSKSIEHGLPNMSGEHAGSASRAEMWLSSRGVANARVTLKKMLMRVGFILMLVLSLSLLWFKMKKD